MTAFDHTAMNTTTLIILNGMLVLGLLAALGLVMSVAHRAAGSDRAGGGHWTDPLRIDDSRRVESDLERAA